MEVDSVKNQCIRMRLVEKRINGEPWQGGNQEEDEYIDLEKYFRPISELQPHEYEGEGKKIREPPGEDKGPDLLDKTLRDLTGILHADKHLLVHNDETLKREERPCWICTRAATRQLRRYSHRFRLRKAKHRNRNIQKAGDQITGDYCHNNRLQRTWGSQRRKKSVH